MRVFKERIIVDLLCSLRCPVNSFTNVFSYDGGLWGKMLQGPEDNFFCCNAMNERRPSIQVYKAMFRQHTNQVLCLKSNLKDVGSAL